MNIGKEYLIHFSGWFQHPINTWSYWYCHEEDVPGYDANNPECGPNTAAYTWDDPGHLWSAHYVVSQRSMLLFAWFRLVLLFWTRWFASSETRGVAQGGEDRVRTESYEETHR